MNNIDKLIKQAVEGHEAPFDPTAWDKLSGQLSPMEDSFRDAVEGHEAPYNPAAWSAIKGQIGGSGLMKWVTGAAGAAAITIAGIYFFPGDTSTVEGNTPIVELNDNTTKLNDILPSETNQNTSENGLNGNSEETRAEEQDYTNEILENSEENLLGVNDLADHTEGINPNLSNDPLNGQDNSEGDQETTENTNNTNTEVSSNHETIGTTETENHIEEPIEQNNWSHIEATYSASEWSTCEGTEIGFNPKMDVAQLNYEWNFGDGTLETITKASHVFKEAGEYDVSLKITDKSGNTVAQSKEKITIYPKPNSNFQWSSLEEQGIPTYVFTHENESSNKTFWFVDNKMYSDKKQFEHTFRTKGAHTVELHTENTLGCQSETSKSVAVENNYNLNAPNAISLSAPGKNEFMPQALLTTHSEFVLTIFDKNGQAIFQSFNANQPWRGFNMNDNTIVSTGAYVWVVKIKNGNGLYEEYSDNVIVVP